jgi:DNA-binding NtrC family response regulator
MEGIMTDKRKLAIVVDDDSMIRDILTRILTSLGYETKAFNSPIDIPCIMETASHDCHFENIPELLITDIQMPEMNGIDFFLQNIQKGCKIKNVAIMSGAWTDESRDVAERFNCKQIDKPFTVSKISEWVKELT